ncbi:MAG: HlyD family efflux transporter periplasmic adaptor subunit [Deltaproteobacteria bacterium]|jgi:multidrug resistance efflux pump|nr:HlyD family efflux transporter periplasmic adaptor subunit [Deltaproteobacteria bacterium]
MFFKRLSLPTRIGMSVALVMALLAAYYMTRFVRDGSQGTVTSLDAYVGGGLTEVRSGLTGQVRRIVDDGEQVRKGDLLLEVASENAALAKQEAEAKLRETLPRLNPVALKILEGYFTLPEDYSVLKARLETALTAAEKASDRVTALSLAHSKSQLAARKLELKEKKSTADKELLVKLQAEDYRLATALELAREEQEMVNNHRAGLEASLRTRALLEQSAAALNDQQKQLLANAYNIFLRLSRAENDLAGSRKFAPADATVVKANFKPGEQVQADRVALLLVPENEDAFWLIATFSADDAEFVVPGAKCRIRFDDGKGVKMSGRVKERIYPDDDLLLPEEAASTALAGGALRQGSGAVEDDPHFKIHLNIDDQEALLYLQNRPDAIVTIIKGSEAKSFIDAVKNS